MLADAARATAPRESERRSLLAAGATMGKTHELGISFSNGRSRRSLVMISSASRLSIAAPSSLRIAAGYREATSSTATFTTAGSGSGVAAAKQKCLDATKKIQDASARSTAEHACNQITTSNANVSTALSKAKQACLTAAAKIPIASLKQAAEAQCNKIAAQ